MGVSKDADPLGVIAREVVALQKEHLGRGPTRASAHLTGDVLIVTLYDPYTPLELAVLRAAGPEALLTQRRHIHGFMGELYRPVVEGQLSRAVLAIMSANHVNPDLAVNIFLLDNISSACR